MTHTTQKMQRTGREVPARCAVLLSLGWDLPYIKALSWTLDRNTAEWFAHRFGKDGTVYTARIKRDDIYAYFSGRKESEVIVDPDRLKKIMVAPRQQVRESMRMK